MGPSQRPTHLLLLDHALAHLKGASTGSRL
jgi:hypothetical protein